jgi:anaerobic selenocysteine-containing dehydrogenase
VVVDPRTSRTAKVADLHLAIRPGADALFLAALANTLLTEGLAVTEAAHVTGLDQLPEALADFTPDAVATATGLAADDIRRLARDLAAAPSAAVYGRIGTCTTRFGTLASWLVDVVNTLSGNLDRPGGVMFPLAAAGQRNSSPTAKARAITFGRFTSAVRGLPEVLGELPNVALAEDILAGHIHALITVAGNPALSVPDSTSMERALASLDVLICIDPYLNETSRHADVVLPVPGPLERSHYDLAFSQLAIHNVAKYTPALFDPEDHDHPVPPEWQTLARLALVLQGAGWRTPPAAVEQLVLRTLLAPYTAAEGSPVYGRDVDELIGHLGAVPGEERLLDALLRLGPYGDGFGAEPEGLTLDRLRQYPHGLDLGPLEPRLPEVLLTPSGLVELAPPALLADLVRLRATLDEPAETLVLVGRRHLRSNNSWGHNLPGLQGGSNRCTLQIHPDDAHARGLANAASATLTSAVGSLVVPLEVTTAIRPGVVSLPHGWGHGLAGTRLKVAADNPGVNTNVLTPPDLDPLSGTAILNAIPVHLLP